MATFLLLSFTSILLLLCILFLFTVNTHSQGYSGNLVPTGGRVKSVWYNNVDTKYNRTGSFTKVGILRDYETGKTKPLLSRQVSSNRHQYFTSENHDGFLMNIPLFDMSGRSCTSGVGCNSIYDGDSLRGLDGSKYQVLNWG